jgi:hypothetical protein
LPKGDRSTLRIVRCGLDVKSWIARPPTVEAVRPGQCPVCKTASRPVGGRLWLWGHGLRSRQVSGPLVADGEQQGIAIISRMLNADSWNPCVRAKAVRRVYDTLRASTHEGVGHEACRCTRCGRRIWVRRMKIGLTVMCPYCGAYHVALRDWKPLPPVVVPTFTSQFIFAGSGSRYAAPSYRAFGPIQVKGHYRKGRWVSSHSRSRSRRRR